MLHECVFKHYKFDMSVSQFKVFQKKKIEFHNQILQHIWAQNKSKI